MTTQTRPDTSGARSLHDTAAPFAHDNLLKLLSAIRGLGIPDAERMELRDRVLEYSQAEEDERAEAAAALKRALVPHAKALEPVLGPIKMTAESEAKTTSSTQPTPGASAKPAADNKPEPKPQPAAAQPVRPAGRQRSAPTFTPPVRPATPVNDATAAPPKPRPVDSPQQRVQPAASPAPNVKPAEDAPELAPEQPAASAPASEAQPAATPTTPASLDAIKARIAEIKRSVNDRVGNPVNLISRNREVGQEYMSALLAAMKRSAPGAAGSAEAMQRLERAYEAVGTALATEPAAPAPTASENVPQRSRPPAAETSPERPEQQEPKQNFHKERESQRAAPVATQPIIPKPPVLQPEREPQKPPVTPVTSPPAQKEPAPEPTPPAAPEPKLDEGPQLRSLASMRQSSAMSVPPPTPPKQPEPESHAPAEPARAMRQTQPSASMLAARAAAQQRSDTPELASDEVTEGLKQLLSEWSLFKKSGFLGTGPSGMEHPLYKRLARLPMAAVIAGRFEGATPEIKQTIADYMNGWRYEQGIVHRMEEQFEQYLRRVIKHIIDKQKREQPPETPGPTEEKAK